MLYVGVDVHKKVCNACIENGEGRVVEEPVFSNDSRGVEVLLEALRGGEAKAVLESTGNLWLRLYVCLEAAGVEVVLANPMKTKAIAQARLKNDKVDARTLADLLRADLVAPCYVPPAEVRELRSLVRHRMNLVRDRTRVKNRIHALLDKYEVKRCPSTDVFGKAGTQWLNETVANNKLLTAVDRLILEAELRHIESLSNLIDEADVSTAKVAKESSDVKLLMSIPGVDYYTALLFTSEVGDIRRFPSAGNLASWLGLTPRVHQSGNVTHSGRITKQGSPRVRWALVQAAHIAVRWDEHRAKQYTRIAQRRGEGKAIVAIAREIATAAYHMLTRKESYRFNAHNSSVNRKLRKMERTANKHVERYIVWGSTDTEPPIETA
jgi:transposase